MGDAEGGEVVDDEGEVQLPANLKLVDNALPEKIFRALAELPHVPNEKKSKRSKEAHWYPVEDAKSKTMRPPRVFIEQVIQYIYRHVHPCKVKKLAGVEWWVHSRRLSDKMHFHFDRDEILWERDGIMVSPAVSSIFYITDTGGATLIVDQRFDQASNGLTPPHPAAGFVLETTENCFATFDGDLLHGVLPAGRVAARLPDADVAEADDEEPEEGARRITLLMNWWTHELSEGSMQALSGELSRDDLWAYGALDTKLKWDAPNKRKRAGEPLVLGKEVRQLYTYDIAVDASSSEQSGCEDDSD